MQAVVAITFGFAVWVSAPGTAVCQPGEAEHAAALRLFSERVETYVSLHRRLEAPLPPMTSTANTWSIFLARRYLASAIRGARPTARQGDIFTPAVATVFRELIREALAGRDVEALLTELNAEHPWEHNTHND